MKKLKASNKLYQKKIADRLANRVNMGLSYKNKTFLAITPLIMTLVENMWVQSRLVEGGLLGRRVP
jgi:hypothetical protein